MEVDITPTTDLIQSWRNQLPRWSTIFGELIDNSFDADATKVEITLESNRIMIKDDGIGCPDLGLMLTAGKHIKHRTTQIGMYGIGFKQAAASAGEHLEVESICAGNCRRGRLNWKMVEKSGSWRIPFPDPEPSDAPSGTTITIASLRNKAGLSKDQIAKLLAHFQEQYTPAMKDQGRQIIVNHHSKTTRLHAAPLPELAHMRNVDLAVGNKQARLLIGIVPEGLSYRRSGLTVNYGFRVIEHGVRWGLGDEPTPGLVGWLDLFEGWNLSTNKEHVIDEHLEQLAKQIAERCADVIALAVKRGYNIPLQEANEQISMVLRHIDLSTPAKERRNPAAVHTGRRLSKHTLRRRRRATKSQDGQAFLQHIKTHGLKISLVNAGDDAQFYAYQSPGIIELNVDNPMIAMNRHNPDYLAAQAIHALASYLVLQRKEQLDMYKGESDYEEIAILVGQLMRYLALNQEDQIPSSAA